MGGLPSREKPRQRDIKVGREEHRDPYTVTKGQWEGCPDGWNDGESVGGDGPLRLRQMGGSCLTMPVPRCCSKPGPCCDDVEETDGRLDPRMLVKLVLRRYGTLLLVIGIPLPYIRIYKKKGKKNIIHFPHAPFYSLTITREQSA